VTPNELTYQEAAVSNKQTTSILLITAVLTAAAPLAHAQEETAVPTTDPERKQVEYPRQRLERSSEGIRVGDFRLSSAIVASEYYDDNIYVTKDNQVDDYVTLLTPTFSAQSLWSRHQLKFDAGGEVARYARNSSENSEDYWVNGSGRYDFTKQTNVFAGAGVSRRHEDRVTPVAVFGVEPTLYDERAAHAGLATGSGAFSVRLAATYDRLAFRDVRTTIGTLNNDDRDRKQNSVGARINYAANTNWTVFLQGNSDRRRYDQAVDDYGYQRDSKGYSAVAGVQYRQGKTLNGELYAGRLKQTYDDARFADVSEPDFGGRLNWRLAAHTTLSAYLDRSLEETTLPGASGYLYTLGGLRANHFLNPDWRVHAYYGRARSDYQGLDRQDDYDDAGAGITRMVTPGLSFSAEYRYLKRDSSVSGDDFTRNQVFLSVTGQM